MERLLALYDLLHWNRVNLLLRGLLAEVESRYFRSSLPMHHYLDPHWT